MTIKTEMAFGDILRLACGVARIVLQNINDAGKGEEYMAFVADCWGKRNPTIAQLLQWTALARIALYDRLGMDRDGQLIVDEEYWDNEDEYAYTRDAEDVYC